jgi:hypothetical protein
MTSLTANGGPNLDKITIVGAAEGTKEFALTIKVQGKGTVVKTPDAPFYTEGTTVQLLAVPDATVGATFVGWTGDITSINLQTSIVINAEKMVTASFKSAVNTTYFCAPIEKGGSDTNTGTKASPFFNITKATDLMEPGDTLYLRGGTYRYKATVYLTKKGSEQERFCIFNYPGEKPVLNFYDIFSSYTTIDATARGEARGFKITGDYYFLKGLEICEAPDNGIKIEGSHNTCELLVLHHNGDSGIQIGLAKESPDAADKVCNNLIKNCDSHHNLDWGTGYENADGFACKLSPGANNRFVACRAWENADDGWDFYMTHYTIYVDSCWATGNGNPAWQQKMIWNGNMDRKTLFQVLGLAMETDSNSVATIGLPNMWCETVLLLMVTKQVLALAKITMPTAYLYIIVWHGKAIKTSELGLSQAIYVTTLVLIQKLVAKDKCSI